MRIRDKQLDHEHRMDVRRWFAQMVMLLLGTVNTVLLVILAWHYADSGQVWPGAAMFGVGSGLTAGAFAAGHAMTRRRNMVDNPAGPGS